ncbi:hypothetical protein [Nocardioides silvaticus]|uniref:hypothetical protein n=1 Tax=Nocardioides silvaticus TaxID=2201891 RepID=UPI0011B29E0D|nr:hypothetical protein [Nocardioides silvaticus]
MLFIVGLGTAIPLEVEPPKPEPKPKPKPEPEIVGMRTKPTRVTVKVNADALLSSGPTATRARSAACQSVQNATADLIDEGAEAALVLIFGGHPDDASQAQRVAAAVGQELTCASPTLFPRKSFGPGRTPTPAEVASGRDTTGVVRPFWNGRLDYGTAQLEIYVFTTDERKGTR